LSRGSCKRIKRIYPHKSSRKKIQDVAYGARTTIERVGKIEGGYLPASQKIHLIADNIRPKDSQWKLSLPGGRKLEVGAHTERAVSGESILRESGPGAGYTEAIKTTLRHEVLGHYSLNVLTPADKKSFLRGVLV